MSNAQFTGMSVVKPHVITDAMLTSSTVLDIAPATYSAGTTYALDALCSVAGALGLITAYKSLQAGNVGNTPASSPAWWAVVNTMYGPYNAGTTYAKLTRCQDNVSHLVYESVDDGNTGNALTDVLKWLKVGPTNKWAAFDNVIGTASASASPMTMVLKPNKASSGLLLFDIDARNAQVTVRDGAGGTVVYDRFLDLDGTIIEDVYDWFFAEFEPLTDLVLTDLPGQYYGAEITVTLTTTNGSMPAAGVIKPGEVTSIGSTQMGAGVGIMDFSKKDRDRFGNFEVIEGAYAKRATLSIVTEKSRFNKIFRTLASMRATPCAYIATDAKGYEPLLIYGFFEDFSIDIPYLSHHLCALRLIGLT